MQRLKSLAIAALLLVGSSVSAQTVYRCGSNYSQTPCANAVEVQTDDPRSDAQRAAAREGLARDKALVKDLEASRRKDAAAALAADRQTLAREKLAIARASAARKQQETVVSKKANSANKRKAKAKPPEVFTSTSTGSGKKSKAASKP